MGNIIKSVKGTRDFYPDEMAVRQWLIDIIRTTSEAFGYQFYDGPCIETLELYAAKSGDELVKEQAFVFPDRGGELLSLRAELTPTLARMVASRQNELTFPLRWWSFGPFWRYERPQRGRTREFFQWNIDLIGTESILADAELVAVAATFLKDVGLRADQVQIRVNNRQLMEGVVSQLGIAENIRPSLLKLIDRIDKQPPEIWEENVLDAGLNQSQLDGLKAVLDNSELWQQSPALCQFFDYIDTFGVREYVTYDPKIIRGLDYYTGIVFEAWDVEKKFRAILGGGHYANLVADVGGNPLPGVGFAMGDVVIQVLLDAMGLIPGKPEKMDAIYVTSFDQDTEPVSLKIASELRREGFKVITSPEPEKLGKQLKYADRISARIALVVGPDEIQANTVVVKDLRTREQQVVARGELGCVLKTILAMG